jgi:cytochrome P450
LILAGTETTATALSGMIYNLLAHPPTFQLSAHEVRSTFSSPSDITIDSARNLPYLSSCMKESQRLYQSTPGTFPRRVPSEGANICGNFVPANIVVGIPHAAAFRSKDNFSNPDEFLPER